jgi:thymidylate synthase ThyX
VATQLIILLARGEGRDELKLFAQQYINQKLDEVISQELNKEMGELYKLINSGASKEVIREWLSVKASEKIVASLN